jgi:heme a synthase
MAASYNRYLHWFVVLGAAIAVVPIILTRLAVPFAVAIAALSLIMTIWQWSVERIRGARIIAVLATAGALLPFLLGSTADVNGRWLAVLLACVAQLVFALLAVLAMLTSHSWQRGSQPVLDSGWPSLNSLSVTAAVLILLDSLFGALFRHQLLGPVLHIAGAMAGVVVVAMLCIFILTQHSGHKSLRQSALALLVVTSVQVLLGIADYMMRLWSIRAAGIAGSVAVLAAVHDAIGALTLSAGAALAIQVSRNVRKPAALSVSSAQSLGTI